jgi:pimeloyl-ACP methyl ester carboxylesterase
MEFVRSADGTKIAWKRGGSGPPLVVVNGALADHTATETLRHWLEPHFTLIGYDRRGRGESGDTRPYAVVREVEDLAAVIGANGTSAFVFGHSAGAVLALEAAMRHLPIDRLAVNEPPYILGGTRPLPPPAMSGQLTLLAQLDDRDAMLELFLRADVGLSAADVRQMREGPAWSALRKLAPSVRLDALLLGRHEMPGPRLLSIGIPTLVLSGTESFDWIRKTARAVADLIPRCELRELAGQDHTPRPHVLGPELMRFFLP